MVIILMIASACPSLQSILPHDIDEAIQTGQQNMRRFRKSVKQFEWHINELEKLDRARKARNIGSLFSDSSLA